MRWPESEAGALIFSHFGRPAGPIAARGLAAATRAEPGPCGVLHPCRALPGRGFEQTKKFPRLDLCGKREFGLWCVNGGRVQGIFPD
jgi:hypothetical protein